VVPDASRRSATARARYAQIRRPTPETEQKAKASESVDVLRIRRIGARPTPPITHHDRTTKASAEAEAFSGWT